MMNRAVAGVVYFATLHQSACSSPVIVLHFPRFIRFYVFWLVVYLPLWKMMEFVSWDDDIPNSQLNGKSLKSMVPVTTKQFRFHVSMFPHFQMSQDSPVPSWRRGRGGRSFLGDLRAARGSSTHRPAARLSIGNLDGLGKSLAKMEILMSLDWFKGKS